MENKAHALAAGIFVTLLTLLVLGLAAWLTRDTGVRDSYEISTRETVTGLQAQAPVRFRGVDVGKVAEVGFDRKTPGNVLLKLEIDREAPLTRETFATLSYQGVTGLSFIQLSDEGRPAPRLVPNEDAPPRIPLRPGLLAKLEERGEKILEKVEEVTVRVNTLLGDENQKRIALALEGISSAAGSADRVVKRIDQTMTQRLDPALAEATVALRGVQKTVIEVGRTANEFTQTASSFNQLAGRLNAQDGPVDRLSSGADALSGAADQFGRSTLPRVNRAADAATRTVNSLNRAINELTENPQALLYGSGAPRPGPGEPGFRSPEARQ